MSMGSIGYLNPIGTHNYGYGAANAALVANVKNQKAVTKTPQGLRSWILMTLDSIAAEGGKNTSNLVYLADQAGSAKTVAEMAPFFGQLKQKAIDYDAPETATAITSAAEWFYYNVEGGKQPSSSSRPTTTPPAVTESPLSTEGWRQFYEANKMPILGMGAVLAITGIWWFWK